MTRSYRQHISVRLWTIPIAALSYGVWFIVNRALKEVSVERQRDLQQAALSLGLRRLSDLPEAAAWPALSWGLNQATLKEVYGRESGGWQQLWLTLEETRWSEEDGMRSSHTATEYRLALVHPQLQLPAFAVYKKTMLAGLVSPGQVYGDPRVELEEDSKLLAFSQLGPATRQLLAAAAPVLQRAEILSMRASDTTLCFWFEGFTSLSPRHLASHLEQYQAIADCLLGISRSQAFRY